MATRPFSAVDPHEFGLNPPVGSKADATTTMMYPSKPLGNVQSPTVTFTGISKYNSILVWLEKGSEFEEWLRDLEAQIKSQIRTYGWDKSYKSVIMDAADDNQVSFRLKIDPQTTFWHKDRTGVDAESVTDTKEDRHRFKGFVVFRAPYVWRKPQSASLSLCAVNVVVVEALDSESSGPSGCVFLSQEV